MASGNSVGHATTVPVRTRTFSDELGVDVSRIVGYRRVFPDGSKGPVRRSIREARQDRQEAQREANP